MAFPARLSKIKRSSFSKYQGTVKYDEGIVHYNEVQVGYCHITSPISGRVGLRLVDPGNLVTANGTTALAVVTQIQPITVVFTVAEDHLNEVLDQLRHGGQAPGGGLGPQKAHKARYAASWPPSTTRSIRRPGR